MKPLQFIKKLLPKEYSLFPQQEKLLTEFYDGDYTDLVGVFGRRSGKDTLLRLIATYECYRLLELGDPYKHYHIPRGNPIYIALIGASSDQMKILFYEVWTMLSCSPYFKDKIDKKQGHDQIWLKDSQGESSICIMAASSNSDNLLGKMYFSLLFNEVAHFKGHGPGGYGGSRLYTALGPSVSHFKGDGHIITMSGPDAEGSILHKLVTTPSSRRLAWHKPTWEMNPHLTEKQLRDENTFLSAQEFDTEFGAKFRTADENTTISIRLSSLQLDALKRLARVKAYESDTDVSYVDIIRAAVQDYLQKAYQ